MKNIITLLLCFTLTFASAQESNKRKRVNTFIFITTITLTVATVPFGIIPVVPFVIFATGTYILNKRKRSR